MIKERNLRVRGDAWARCVRNRRIRGSVTNSNESLPTAPSPNSLPMKGLIFRSFLLRPWTTTLTVD